MSKLNQLCLTTDLPLEPMLILKEKVVLIWVRHYVGGDNMLKYLTADTVFTSIIPQNNVELTLEIKERLGRITAGRGALVSRT